MTEPNLSALTHMEKLVFGANAKKDALGNIIEQGSGNLHDRVKAAEAAIKKAMPNIPVDTVTTLAQNSIASTLIPPAAAGEPGVNLQSAGAPGSTATPVAPVPAAVTVAPVPVTPAPVAAATNSEPAVTAAPVPITPTPATAPVATTTPEPVTVAAVQAAVPAAPATVIAATIAAQPKATHETIVAKLKAIFASAEAAAEEIL